jgi:predicted AAA+ superfamily ATPase
LIQLSFSESIQSRLDEPRPLIQVVLGPRQVGKTTGIRQALAALEGKRTSHYASADAVFRSDWSWIERQWRDAEKLGTGSILVLDEIQKIDNWSEVIKKLWDETNGSEKFLRVVLLGSSSLALQAGLTESLTGRFELIRAYHWNFVESEKAFSHTIESYLAQGGYPGADRFREDDERWLAYLKNSIVETVIEKDILLLRRVERPALFRQVFELACSYPASELSLRKLVGQLQDTGSIETVKHYLELLEGAFLVRTLQKFSTNPIQKKSSSPKIMPLCPALCAFARGEVRLSAEQRGRILELIVGMDLMRLSGDLFYWRQDHDEVDYVYRKGNELFAVEVKSGRKAIRKNKLVYLCESAISIT